MVLVGFFDWLVARLADGQAVVLGKADALVPAVPASVSAAPAQLTGLSGWISPVAVWLPWTYLGVALAIVLLGLVAGVSIKLLRIGASFATLGGGSAG